MILLLLLACVTLQPWERVDLMTRVMADPFDPTEAAFDAHVRETREGMTGADAAGGAACGCN
ncbi:MAG: DUF4266 domain-containing protein [Pseudomonadota bacterium]|nr:DUF4266 domain-containing protein [Pseudomonadota bacterium]